ncbi:MAG: DUF4190 domain-containing protein [Phycisphaerales bacterium]|nr:DUF4190 domain-containing protein [Phycisphaerales bacterium]
MQDEFGTQSPQTQSNTLGMVGFILAFCLSPIGLVLSAIALRKQPRGFAIGGVIVGLLGTIAWVAFGIMIGFGALIGIKVGEGMMDYQLISNALEADLGNNGEYPADLSALAVDSSALMDPWGTEWRYEKTSTGYTLTSACRDGAFDTDDDIVLRPNMTQDELSTAFSQALARSFGGQP